MEREDQHIDCIKTGLVNTMFRDQSELVRNFGMFFGDGKISTEDINCSIVKIKVKSPRYNRMFEVTYTQTNNKVFPNKILRIEEL